MEEKVFSVTVWTDLREYAEYKYFIKEAAMPSFIEEIVKGHILRLNSPQGYISFVPYHRIKEIRIDRLTESEKDHFETLKNVEEYQKRMRAQ